MVTAVVPVSRSHFVANDDRLRWPSVGPVTPLWFVLRTPPKPLGVVTGGSSSRRTARYRLAVQAQPVADAAHGLDGDAGGAIDQSLAHARDQDLDGIGR